MRTKPTEAEAVLWRALRQRQLGGWRWRRRHLVSGYIADFYCPALHLVLEVDGAIHETTRDEDARRDRALQSCGCEVLRVRNDDILADVDRVADRVLALCERLVDTSPRKSGGGREGGHARLESFPSPVR
jgi:very-short-patch-repair endonuclease